MNGSGEAIQSWNSDQASATIRIRPPAGRAAAGVALGDEPSFAAVPVIGFGDGRKRAQRVASPDQAAFRARAAYIQPFSL
jgi:hypothetical protein